jgi:hypothetical protein
MKHRISYAIIRGIVSLGCFFATPLMAGSPGLDADGKDKPGPDQGVVVDANGKFVGALLSQNVVTLKLNGIWVALGVTASGFPVAGTITSVHFYYPTSDCSGPSYINIDLPRTALTVQSPQPIPVPTPVPTILFAGNPVQNLHILSYVPYNGNNVVCTAASPNTYILVGPTQGIPLSSLGLTPPFTVKSRL